MADDAKVVVPPYTTFASFNNLLNSLRESRFPSHITRAVVPGSNSAKATMIASLKALGLIEEDGTPTSDLRQLVQSSGSEEKYKESLKGLLEKRYSFLMDSSIDISSTTTEKVAELFRERGASGSTVAKGMSFFLTAAKHAGIEVSPYVKPPKTYGRQRKTKPQIQPSPSGGTDSPDPSEAYSGMSQELSHLKNKDRITISAYGMDDWEVFVPKDLSDGQWKHGLKIAIFMLENYRQQHEEVKHDT